MLSPTDLPGEAHIGALKHDEAIRRALNQASQRALSRTGFWAAYAMVGLTPSSVRSRGQSLASSAAEHQR